MIENQLIKKLEPIVKEIYGEIAESKSKSNQTFSKLQSESDNEANEANEEENEESTENNLNSQESSNLPKESKPIPDISIKDICLIYSSFVKLKAQKPKLFEILESLFIKRIYEADPETLTTMTFCHSFLSSDLLVKYNENKKDYLKRSLKKIKFFLLFNSESRTICTMR